MNAENPEKPISVTPEPTAVATADGTAGSVNATADETAGATAAPGAPAGARKPRRVFPYVLGGVLVLGVAGGATYTGVTVARADRHAPTVEWADLPEAGKDPAATEARRGRSSTPLSKMLLPVPGGYRLGPDVGQYGNDSELTGDDAIALAKEAGKGLAGSKRREFDRRIEKLGIKGVAVRSYVSDQSDRLVNVQVQRVTDQRVGRESLAVQRDLASFLHLGKGPKIEGHKNASCFMKPKSKKDKDRDRDRDIEPIDGMTCSAYEGEYIVTVDATGAGPLDRSEIADLVKQQLDHLKSPGEYI
ncbi:hypothetical protein ACGFRB_00255 [Streptomyces sp. NPDC048718]|uniref:hypothetical protein n=1 Tax=Streptomyces sp. NPDC048718 TaxID=3365587 RepID=UPI00371A8B36